MHFGAWVSVPLQGAARCVAVSADGPKTWLAAFSKALKA